MSYTVPECFMAAFAAGLMFSLVYEALRIVRVIFPFRIVVFVCDVVFFLLAALAVTRLSMALGDHIRWSTVFGFGAGIFAYINTLGRLLNLLGKRRRKCSPDCAVAVSIQSAELRQSFLE